MHIMASRLPESQLILDPLMEDANMCPLKSIVLALMATDFISRWNKSRTSFTFND